MPETVGPSVGWGHLSIFGPALVDRNLHTRGIRIKIRPRTIETAERL